MKRSHAWIGAETYQKERDFRGLVEGIHIPICTAIRQRQGRPADPPYLFMDLNGGPGRLCDDDGRLFDGSPLIAANALFSADIPHRTVHFERDAKACRNLAAVMHPDSFPYSTVISGDFQAGVSAWLDENPPHGYRYGLVYSDPIGDPIPVAEFNLFATHSPRVDLLAYVAANSQYKRRGAHRLGEDVAAVRKRHALIRELATAHEFTFVLFTNWTDFPAWRKQGFYPIDSHDGQRILYKASTTREERRELVEVPLW